MSSTHLNSRLKYNFFRFGKRNVRHIRILLPVSIILLLLSACYFASTCQISISDHLLHKYNVISIFQDGCRGRPILLPVSYLLMSVPTEGQNLSPNQISLTYLHSQPRYYYFWFGKTNVCRIGILLPVLISTNSRNLHVILHQATEFCPHRSTHCKNMSDVIYIYQEGSMLLPVSYLLMSLPSEGQSISKPNFVDISQFDSEI